MMNMATMRITYNNKNTIHRYFVELGVMQKGHGSKSNAVISSCIIDENDLAVEVIRCVFSNSRQC